MAQDCWPDWLKRRSAQRLGPEIDDVIPYPVYQQQPTINSAENNLSPSINVGDAYYECFAGRILLAVINTTIVKVTPRHAYDTIMVTAFDNDPGGAPTNLDGVPILFSFDRPGRITQELPMQGRE